MQDVYVKAIPLNQSLKNHEYVVLLGLSVSVLLPFIFVVVVEVRHGLGMMCSQGI